MKKLFGLALLAIAGVAMAQNSNKLTIKGEVGTLGDTVLVFRAQDRNLPPDTVLARNGTIDYSISLDKPQWLYIAYLGNWTGSERHGSNFRLLGVPGEVAVIKPVAENVFHIGGSKFYVDYNEAKAPLDSAMMVAVDAEKEFYRRVANGENTDAVRGELMKKMDAAFENSKNAIIDYVKTHPDNDASAAMIPLFDDLDDMEKAVVMLSERVKNGRMKPVYSLAIESARKAIEEEKQRGQLQASGIEAPDFTLNDITGKPLSLSSLKGKYVVIDFWGSWCGWCIKGMPKMKEYYAKYKGKFEILGVDCNDTEEKWKAAVAKYELPWLHVYNPRNTEVLQKYGISGFPTKILVGPDGKIVQTVVGEDPAFYTLLDNILGE